MMHVVAMGGNYARQSERETVPNVAFQDCMSMFKTLAGMSVAHKAMLRYRFRMHISIVS